VELALKAALRAAGVEPPRWHDVGAVLTANAARLPASLREIADRLVRISAALRQDREPAFYGDEAGDRTPGELYGEADARRAHADAAFAVEHVRDALLTDEPS
jgi:HEPN domain-containing protein